MRDSARVRALSAVTAIALLGEDFIAAIPERSLMTFSDWDHYTDLLDKMRIQRSVWDAATHFEDFIAAVRYGCPELLGTEGYSAVGEHGLDALVAALEAELRDPEPVFAQIRISALARPAEELGLGPEWADYLVSERLDGASAQEVYSTDRFAEPSDWELVEVSTRALALEYDESLGLMRAGDGSLYLRDGVTPVWPHPDRQGAFVDEDGNVYVNGELAADTVEDPRVQHFDPDSGRWRRWSDQGGEYEYYHDADGVWERIREGCYRHHGDRFGWIRYDHGSDTWLDPTTPVPQWRAHDEIGTPPAPPEPGGAADRIWNALPDEGRAALDELTGRALAAKPASMSDQDALRLLTEALLDEVGP